MEKAYLVLATDEDSVEPDIIGIFGGDHGYGKALRSANKFIQEKINEIIDDNWNVAKDVMTLADFEINKAKDGDSDQEIITLTEKDRDYAIEDVIIRPMHIE